MIKSLGITLLLLFTGTVALASSRPFSAPEIDPSQALAAFVLLGGSLTVMRARRRK